MIEIIIKNKELWDLFTKKEEYNPAILDGYQRFPYYLSKYRDILEPNVSKFLIENGRETKYPGKKNFAVCLTHDIDSIYFPRIMCAYLASKNLKHFQFRKTISFLGAIFSKAFKARNPLLNFRKIIDLEKKYAAKSTFYFLASDKDKINADYDVKGLKNELKYIINNGWEVGLHGSFEAYEDFERIKTEKEKLENILNEKIVGYRNHCLRFRTPDTWELVAKAGFKYDTSFGYADMVGFRNGMCHPFKPFNLKTNKEIDILEIPLTIMDGTLFDYMKLDEKKAWETIRLLIDTVERYSGVITILWHNTSFDKLLSEGKLKLYERILDYCHKKNAWLANGKEIWQWYEDN